MWGWRVYVMLYYEKNSVESSGSRDKVLITMLMLHNCASGSLLSVSKRIESIFDVSCFKFLKQDRTEQNTPWILNAHIHADDGAVRLH